MPNIKAVALFVVNCRIIAAGSQVTYTERKVNMLLKYFVSFLVTQLIRWLNIIDHLSFSYIFFDTMSVIGESAKEIY
jgi:hypothetical protein